MYTPSLPYRRLVKFANGIWDENRKTFYPFKVTNTTLPAKRGISYFVHTIVCTGTNTGDAAVTSVGYAATVLGVPVYLMAVVPVSTAAS